MLKKILIVEDNHDLREMTAQILRHHFFDVTEACDVKSGKEKILAERPDFVFTDADMPGGGSGFDIVDVANEMEIPVLMASGRPQHSHPADRVSRLREGQFIDKPYRIMDIVDRIYTITA